MNKEQLIKVVTYCVKQFDALSERHRMAMHSIIGR